MVRRLVANITLMSDEGVVEHFPVGTLDSEVPDWAAARITNPLVWDEPEAEVVALLPPPKSGSGSSAGAWVEYARAAGVVVKEDAKRDDVIVACEAADVPTE